MAHHFQPTAPDISVLITVPSSHSSSSSSTSSTTAPPLPPLLSAERRISPSWTISQLKTKLEPVTGIPPGCQRLRTRRPFSGTTAAATDGEWIAIDDDDADGQGRRVGDRMYGLRAGSEIEVYDNRPTSTLTSLTDLSSVPKYTMPTSQYEQLDDSVLAWKRKNRLGRFDPTAKSPAELAAERRSSDETEISSRGITVGMRCRVGGSSDGRRGVVRFVGEIPGLGGEKEAGCRWVGVELDEPVGRNDGSVKVMVTQADDDEEDENNGSSRTSAGRKKEVLVKRVFFRCKDQFGVFVRPEKIEVGDQWAVLDDFDILSDNDNDKDEDEDDVMEEI